MNYNFLVILNFISAVFGRDNPDDFRILGGNDVPNIENFAYQVSLQAFINYNSEIDILPFCGGIIMAKNIILTAAHCIQNFKEEIQLPAKFIINCGNIRRLDYDKTSQIGIIKEIINHPKYNEIESMNDLSILVLQDPLEYTREVNYAKLPTKDDGAIGKIGVISGWGLTGDWKKDSVVNNNLQFAEVPIKSYDECRRVLVPEWPESGDDKICAGDLESTPCLGDSGGPLVINHNEPHPTIIGVTSFGLVFDNKTDCIKIPAVFSRVSFNLEWIQQQLDERAIF